MADDEKSILYEGFLSKRGGSKTGHGWSSWKKRWFRLTGETLGYYKDEKSTSPLGEFEIRVDLQLVENTANEINFEIITFDREDPMLIKAPNAQV